MNLGANLIFVCITLTDVTQCRNRSDDGFLLDIAGEYLARQQDVRNMTKIRTDLVEQ